jgi:hypothetical protein
MKTSLRLLILMLNIGHMTFGQTSDWIPSQVSWLNDSLTHTIVSPSNLLDNNEATDGYLSMSYYSNIYTKEMYLDFGTAKTIDGFKFAYIFPNCLQGACSSYPGPINYTCKGNLYYKNQSNQWISAFICQNLNAYDNSLICPMTDSILFTFIPITAQQWKFEMIGLYWLGGSYQSTNFSNVQTNQCTFNWTDGDGSSRAVFIKQDSTGTALPINNSSYIADAIFGSGSQIGTTGWYCAFNGTTHVSGVTVTNLLPNTYYQVMVCEYNGDPGFEQYNASIANNNPIYQLTCSDSMPIPNAEDLSICIGTFAILTASGGNNYIWYDAPMGGTQIALGPVFTTPILTSTTNYYVSNFNGTCESARETVIVTVNPCKTLDTKVFLEGLYAGRSTMYQAFDNLGPHFGPDIADQITVELHNISDYNTIEFSATNVNLSTIGNATVYLPITFYDSYYITITVHLKKTE